jgi:hypothetical protein
MSEQLEPLKKSEISVNDIAYTQMETGESVGLLGHHFQRYLKRLSQLNTQKLKRQLQSDSMVATNSTATQMV